MNPWLLITLTAITSAALGAIYGLIEDWWKGRNQ